MRRSSALGLCTPFGRRPRPVQGARLIEIIGVCGCFACLLPLAVARAAPVSFAEARERAMRLAPDVRVAALRVAVARAGIAIAGTWANPTLSVSSATRTAHLGTALSVPLPLFGQRGTGIDAAREDAAVSARDANVTQHEARFAASVAWIDLWEAERRVTLLEIAAADAARLFSIAAERFDAGSGPRVDVVRTRAGNARAAADVVAARAGVRAAGMRLLPWLAAEREGEPSARGEIGYPAELPPLDALASEQAEHPALVRDRAQLVAAGAHVRSEKRLRFPIVNAELGVNQFDPTLSGPDFIGGLSFELPLLNQRGGAIERAHAERVLAAAEADADRIHLRAELEAAYREAEAASSELRALHGDVVPALLEARHMTEESYRSGRVDLVRLLETQRALLESQLAELAAVAAFGRAYAALERAAGRRLDRGVADAR